MGAIMDAPSTATCCSIANNSYLIEKLKTNELFASQHQQKKLQRITSFTVPAFSNLRTRHEFLYNS
jgi:hypothetical protein